MPRACLTALMLTAATAAAQPDRSGIDFVTITNPNNPAWPGDNVSGDNTIGRGSVAYDYRIGRYEVTTAQWVEFFNAAFDRPSTDHLPFVIPPTHWGAVSTTPQTPGAQRWAVPAGNEVRPVGNISWRMAAMYCNWLCNDKRIDRAAFMNGAYDVSTFGLQGTGFTDQLTHNPSAAYWIPTLDESLKAAHWSPTNPNRSGWYLYDNASDTRPAYGPPGLHVSPTGLFGPDPSGPLASANGGWTTVNFPGYNPFSVPLGAYGVQSPWGLYDTAGGTSEWNEYVFYVDGTDPSYRGFDGSAWATSQPGLADHISFFGGETPDLSSFDLGLRVASIVPAPPTVACFCLLGSLVTRRARGR